MSKTRSIKIIISDKEEDNNEIIIDNSKKKTTTKKVNNIIVENDTSDTETTDKNKIWEHIFKCVDYDCVDEKIITAEDIKKLEKNGKEKPINSNRDYYVNKIPMKNDPIYLKKIIFVFYRLKTANIY